MSGAAFCHTTDQRDRYNLLAHLIAARAVTGGPRSPAWEAEYAELHRLWLAWLDDNWETA